MVLMSSMLPTPSPDPPPGVSTPLGRDSGHGSTHFSTSTPFFSPQNNSSPGSAGMMKSGFSSSRKQPRTSESSNEENLAYTNPLLSPGYSTKAGGATDTGGVVLNANNRKNQRMNSLSDSDDYVEERASANNFQETNYDSSQLNTLRQRRTVTGRAPVRQNRQGGSSPSVSTALVPAKPLTSKISTTAPPPPRLSLSLQQAPNHAVLQASRSTSSSKGNNFNDSSSSNTMNVDARAADTSSTLPAAYTTRASGTNNSKWVLVYGFTTLDQFNAVDRRFRQLGTVLQHKGGWNPPSNWIAFQYSSSLEVAKALGQNHIRLDSNSSGGGGGFFCGVKHLEETDSVLIEPAFPNENPFLFGGKEVPYNKSNESVSGTTEFSEHDIFLDQRKTQRSTSLMNNDPSKQSACVRFLRWILNVH